MKIEQTLLDFTGSSTRPPPKRPSRSEVPDEALAVAEYVARHCRGPGNARTAAVIGSALALPVTDQARRVRRLLSAYRDALPTMILGDPGRGFFVPDTADQVSQYDRMLFGQLRSVASTLSAHRRLARNLGYCRSGSGPRVTYADPPPVAQNP